MTNEKLIDALNELILFNTDRITGYEKAIKETEDLDTGLKTIFSKMAQQSEGFRSELENLVTQMGGEISEGRTNLGKLYQAWMDLKQSFTGNDRQSILNSCEFGEDAILKAYKAALASDAEMSSEIRQLILEQKEELMSSHDVIKKLRDTQKAIQE